MADRSCGRRLGIRAAGTVGLGDVTLSRRILVGDAVGVWAAVGVVGAGWNAGDTGGSLATEGAGAAEPGNRADCGADDGTVCAVADLGAATGRWAAPENSYMQHTSGESRDRDWRINRARAAGRGGFARMAQRTASAGRSGRGLGSGAVGRDCDCQSAADCGERVPAVAVETFTNDWAAVRAVNGAWAGAAIWPAPVVAAGGVDGGARKPN